MVKYEPVTAILRFYPEDTDQPLAKFTAACTLLYESADVIWIKALAGTLSRKNLRELLRFCLDNKISMIKMIRANSSFPYVTKVEGNYCEIDIANNIEKFEKVTRDT